MTKKYHRIVEHEDYPYQKRNLDFGDFLVFLLGISSVLILSSFITDDTWMSIVGYASFFAVLFLSQIRRRKVYYIRI